ncbi:hypothetical protein ACOMHN_056914 [Nucella lapillus]
MDSYQDKRSVRRPKKRSKDCPKVSLKDLDINLSSWQSLALDCSNWRSKLPTEARAADPVRCRCWEETHCTQGSSHLHFHCSALP